MWFEGERYYALLGFVTFAFFGPVFEAIGFANGAKWKIDNDLIMGDLRFYLYCGEKSFFRHVEALFFFSESI